MFRAFGANLALVVAVSRVLKYSIMVLGGRYT